MTRSTVNYNLYRSPTYPQFGKCQRLQASLRQKDGTSSKLKKADVEGFLKVAYGKSRKKYRTSDYTIQKTDINIISTVVLIESNYKTEIFPSYNYMYVSQV